MGSRTGLAQYTRVLFLVATMTTCGTAAGIERTPVLRATPARVQTAPPGKRAAPRRPVPSVAPAPAPQKAKPAEPKAPARAVAEKWTPFASVGGVVLVHPADRVERVAFHQASDVATRQLTMLASAVKPRVLPSRGRRTSARSAADIVVDPRSEIRAPVSGIVKRARGYKLYCKYADGFAVISPDGHPELEVKVLHISGLRVRPGDRVVAGKSKLALHATRFPFSSQVDSFTARPAWPHVHIEVTKLAVPSAIPQPGKSLTIGCP